MHALIPSVLMCAVPFLACGEASSGRQGREPQPPLPAPAAPEAIVPTTKETRLTGALTLLAAESVHWLALKKEHAYAIQMESRGFFTALRIEDGDKKVVHTAQGGYFTFQPAADGVFRVSVSSPGGSNGEYAVSVQIQAPPKKGADGVLEFEGGSIVLTGLLPKPQPGDKIKKKPTQAYDVRLQAGKAYVIDLMSKQFDAYLRVESSDGKTLAQDDDSGDGNNARIRFQPKTDGVYRVVATVFGASGNGMFVLKVRME